MAIAAKGHKAMPTQDDSKDQELVVLDQSSVIFGAFVATGLFVWVLLWIPSIIVTKVAYERTDAGEKSLLVDDAEDCQGGLRHTTEAECLRGLENYRNYQDAKSRIFGWHLMISFGAACTVVSFLLVSAIFSKLSKS